MEDGCIGECVFVVSQVTAAREVVSHPHQEIPTFFPKKTDPARGVRFSRVQYHPHRNVIRGKGKQNHRLVEYQEEKQPGHSSPEKACAPRE